MRFFVLTFLALALAACASSTPQADSLLPRAHKYPSHFQVEGVPFIEQSDYQCGPATLTMALQWAGKNITVEKILPQVYTPGMKGSLQSDMISASRRQGMIAIPLEGLDSLLTEVSAGHPVVVFENLTFNWLPTWHYAIVFGYDLSLQTVTMHSGKEAFKHWDIRKFERSWKLGDYWGLVILPPGELAASADELAHLKATSALEQIGKADEADRSYQKILQRWPLSLAARIGRANIAFNRKDYSDAIQQLKQATADHPQTAVAWHNLAIAYGADNQKALARKTALHALELASPQERTTYSENLKEWIQ